MFFVVKCDVSFFIIEFYCLSGIWIKIIMIDLDIEIKCLLKVMIFIFMIGLNREF